LVEVMIAVVVLSFGLLAVAAMQEMALSRNIDANELSIVTNLASDMLERIRFNRQNAITYSGIDTTNVGTRPAAPMAQGDYDQWSARLAATRLRGVRGQVTVTSLLPASLNESQVTVLVTWNGGAQGGTEALRSRAISLVTLVAPD
jgi:type IV pilus assembly protein PilV